MMRLGVGLVAVLALAGCARGGASAADGEPWGRTFLSQTTNHPLVPGTRIELRFADGSVSVRAGCNHIGGDARIDGGRLRVSEVSTTDMGCDPPRHEQDTWLATFLQAGPTLRLDGADLVLKSGDTTITFLDREQAEPDAQLAGPKWTVDTLIDGQTAGSMPSGVRADLSFTTDGKITGFGGCNSLTGTYAVTGKSIKFTAMGSTYKGCTTAGQVEDKILHVLRGTVQYKLEGNHLTLTAADGTGLGLSASP